MIPFFEFLTLLHNIGICEWISESEICVISRACSGTISLKAMTKRYAEPVMIILHNYIYSLTLHETSPGILL